MTIFCSQSLQAASKSLCTMRSDVALKSPGFYKKYFFLYELISKIIECYIFLKSAEDILFYYNLFDARYYDKKMRILPFCTYKNV